MGRRANLQAMSKAKIIVGRRVAELRCGRGLTQEEFARALGVSARTVGNVEREQSMPDLAIVIGIADFFEVSVDYLVGRSATP